jgi:hypothetical protein
MERWNIQGLKGLIFLGMKDVLVFSRIHAGGIVKLVLFRKGRGELLWVTGFR